MLVFYCLKFTIGSHTVKRIYNPRKSRNEWKQILADKEINNLSVRQVASMYTVSEGSVYQWISNFKKEFEEMPKTVDHVKDLITQSITDLKTELDDNINSIIKNQARQVDILDNIKKLEASLGILKAPEELTR